MQKVIMSILLLIMASVPITAYAITVNVNGSQYSAEGGYIEVTYDDGQIACSSASNFGGKGATFEFREAGDIKDMVMSDVLCFNYSGSTLPLNIFFYNQFNVAAIQTRWYFMSLQGSFFSIFGGPAQPSDLNASAFVIFFQDGQQSDPVFIGSTSGNFTDSFGPQNPLQIVNVIDCTGCDPTEFVIPVFSASLAPGDGIYLFGSQHGGSGPSAQATATFLGSLTATIDVHNPVNVNSNGHIQVDLLGANSMVPVTNSAPIVVKFDVRSVDIKSLQFGPLGGPFVTPVSTHFKDWNKDKIEDVRVKFRNPQWSCEDTVAVLTGNINGTTFTATQNITPQPCP